MANKEQKLFIKEVSALSLCEIASINFVKAIIRSVKPHYRSLIVKPAMAVAHCVN